MTTQRLLAASCASLLTFIVLLAGCGGESVDPTAPPDGWEADGDRWWRTGVDTASAFRDLDSLSSMGVDADVVYSTSAANISADQFADAVKRELLPLYRHQPRVIDSLFESNVRDIINQRMEEQGVGSSISETVTELRSEGYEVIRESFREPSSTTTLGEDVPVTYPDSLRQRDDVSGRVRMQVYLDEEGTPQAIRLLEGVHPFLNQGAMRTAALSTWRPAFVLQSGTWSAVPSWVRSNLRFP